MSRHPLGSKPLTTQEREALTLARAEVEATLTKWGFIFPHICTQLKNIARERADLKPAVQTLLAYIQEQLGEHTVLETWQILDNDRTTGYNGHIYDRLDWIDHMLKAKSAEE